MRSSSRRFYTLAIALVVSVCSSVLAQTTANIHGTVSDQTGGLLPGVSVVAISEGTGFQRTTVSLDDGTYLISLLPLGTYRIEAEVPGFRKLVRRGIDLTIGENARVDLVLEIGEISDQVTVEAGATGIETRQATISYHMDQKRVDELPLSGRDPQQLIQLIPAATSVSIPETGVRRANVAVSGGEPAMNSFEVDGARWTQTQLNVGLAMPPPDMIKEFRAETNRYDAAEGRGAIASFKAVTQSGTNDFHGRLFHFHRNSALNARNFFRTDVPFLVYNQFGGTFGGPILKDRTFFFGGYQGTRIAENAFSNTAFPPTELERNGDFSQSAVKPIDPMTGDPFPNDQIPSSRVDPAARIMLDQFLPLPNTSDGRYEFTRSRPFSRDSFLARFDHGLFQNNQLNVRFWRDSSDTTIPRGNVPYNTQFYPFSITNITLSNTHTFGPNLINELQVSYHRHNWDIINSHNFTPADLGIDIPNPLDPFPPNVSVIGRFNLEAPHNGQPAVRGWLWDFKQNVHIEKGKHSLKLGFNYEKDRYLARVNFDNGTWQFNGELTGDPLADFMLGHVSWLRFLRQQTDMEAYLVGMYAQDNYQISRNVNINLGLRYDFRSVPQHVNGYHSTWIPGFQSTRFPNAPIGLAFQDDPGVPDGMYYPDKNDFGPRLGIAWDISGKGQTSLRAGYGVFYQLPSVTQGEFTTLNQPFIATIIRTGVEPLSDPFRDLDIGGIDPDDPLAIFDPATDNAKFLPPVSPWVMDPFRRSPYIQQYSLAIQQRLPQEMTLEVAYVGSTGRKLPRSLERNPADCFDPANCTLDNREERRRYNPGQLASLLRMENARNSHYNSLQVNLTKRFAQSYLFNANYTWSRDLSEGRVDANQFYTAPYRNPDDPGAEYGLSDYHRSHVFSASWVWETPFFRSHPAPVLRHAFGGWQVTGLFYIASGQPFTLVSGRDNSLTAVGHDRPDLVGDPNLSSDRSRAEKIAMYFNTSAFQHNAPGTFGNVGRNTLIGPGVLNADIGLVKNFRFRERHTLQLRSEFFNFMNRPNFGNPTTSLVSGSFGRIFSASEGRRIQFGLKYMF